MMRKCVCVKSRVHVRIDPHDLIRRDVREVNDVVVQNERVEDRSHQWLDRAKKCSLTVEDQSSI